MPDTTTLPEGDAVTTPVVPSTHTFLPSLTKFASVNDKSPKLPIRVSCFEILKLADEDPWKWFTAFADPKFTFLGREFTGGLHEELAKHLREIEKKNDRSG